MEDLPRIGHTCSRCGGLMVFERFTQEANRYQTSIFWGWRCVLCGDIIDKTILENRERA